MSGKRKQLLLNLFVLFFALSFSVIVAEALVRAFSIGPKEENWVGADKLWYEYDSLLGWRKIPNTGTTRVSIRGRNSVFYQVNSKGIRGPEYPYEKPYNQYRILFLGDSFTEGYMVEEDDHFAGVMKRKLNNMKSNKHFEALNSGVAGWSTDQELLFFQNEGKKYKPDLTILMFYQNDLYYNNQPKDWGMYYKPLFKISNGKLVLTNVPVPKPDKIAGYSQLSSSEQSIFKRIRTWLYANSHLYNLIKERIRNVYFLHKIAIQFNLVEKPAEGKYSKNSLPKEYGVWEKTYTESVRDIWHITEALIAQLKKETAAVDGRLLVFYIPDETSIHREDWINLKKKYGITDDNYDTDKPGLDLEAVCKRNGIDFLNPTDMFKAKARELGKEGKRLYDPVDHHWNVHGYRFAGEILADYVDRKYLVD
jgi:hypothetical protein